MYKFKNYFKEWYQPQERFVVRDPLFTIGSFFDWQAAEEKNESTAKDALRKQLKEFYIQPIAQEALYIGSPDLHEQMLLWLEDKIEKEDKKEKTELSLVKYMIRMCTRCTPYGLFASCTAGIFSDTTTIKLSGKESVQRYGRLDMDYVCELHTHLLKQKEIIDQLLFFPNTSLYRLGDQWRYIEHRFAKETGRSYHLVEVDQSSYLEKVVKAAEDGCKPLQLAEIITDDDISLDEAYGFVYELIQSQVLVDELAPSVTGDEYYPGFLSKLKTVEGAEKYIGPLEKVSELFNLVKANDNKVKNSLYQQIAGELKQIEVPLHLKTLIQVDSYRYAQNCSLNNNVNEEILSGLGLLQVLTREDAAKDPFADFKKEFMDRYEGEFVPLVEVLDTESGIGYGKFATSGMEESPLIDKLPIGNDLPDPSSLLHTDSYKWEIYQQAIAENKIVIPIDDKTIEKLSKKEFEAAGLPDSICVMVKINATSANEIDKGHYTITLQSSSGPSGGNLLGRFCHVHPGIEEMTQTVLKEEEAHKPDCVFAEVVHLPESRIGNILMRPVLRKYEIPYLCGTSLGKEFQIPVSDLLIGIESDKVVLRSKRLHKEIIPRLTTAHNFNLTTLPVYQFLCDLQFQGVRNVSWHWGMLENRPFLPRVTYGRFIFSKARWVLNKEELKDCDKRNDGELKSAFTLLKGSRKLPEYVLLSQGDNELLLDLNNIFCIRLLLSEVNKSGTVSLTEVLDHPGSCWVESPDGRHPAEFIFSFSRKQKEFVKQADPGDYKENKNIRRYFPVGSEWLYAKIYCGTKTSEKLLANLLGPLAKELLSENLADKFFFLRYSDPRHHIRVRFHNSQNKDFWKEIISRLQKELLPWFENHSVHNFQLETYRREVERYGFDTMELSEDIFWHQSEATLDFISLLEGDEGEQYRWQVALKAIDLFLDDFCYSTERKRDLVRLLNKDFSKEFRIGSAQRKKISERFSDHKQIVQVLLSNDWQTDENLSKAIHVFVDRNNDYRNVIKEILRSPSVMSNDRQTDQLMSSYLHMFINRLFLSNQRKMELMIYEYLFRYYESKLAREKSRLTSFETLKVNNEIPI